MLELHTPIQYVKGIGPRVSAVLNEKGIYTVEDLLYYLPFRYEDRANPRSLAELKPGEMASIIAEVRSFHLYRTKNGIPIFELVIGQGMKTIVCTWFHGAYLKDRFKAGQTLALYGKVEEGWGKYAKARLQLMQPQVEVLGVSDDDPEDLLTERLENSVEIGRIVPVYEAIGKLNSRWFRNTLHRVLKELSQEIPDGIPAAVRDEMNLISRRQAFEQAHFPTVGESFAALESRSTPAHRRLIFEELFFLEVGLELKRRNFRRRTGISFELNDRVREAIKRFLPFRPTGAQKKVLGEIAADMQTPVPMRRLLQGDVGSGKTLVALEAAMIAIENGYQAALMAPTEILATQHYLSARKLLEPHGYRVMLLTGSLEEDRKRSTRRHIAQGNAQLVIGTHALIEEKVEFSKLGLIVVDEQHRFGVLQRWRLMRKPSDNVEPGAPGQVSPGSDKTQRSKASAANGSAAIKSPDGPITRSPDPTEPDVLVMTATPIPRTLALTLYGDLDSSILDELPPGRSPIVTRRVTDERAPDVWDFVRKQATQGRQIYVVYPVIESAADEDDVPVDVREAELGRNELKGPTAAPGRVLRREDRQAAHRPRQASLAGIAPPPKKSRSERTLNLKSATAMYEELRKKIFPDLRVALLHGRLSSDDKDIVMARFQRGEIDVLVATTVIEVGVDVPNATVMVIEHAERFGLSQLHQLRGRIGRGAHKSYCVLMTGGKISPEGERRLEAMTKTQDGFEIAELDLELRGPGEFFGTKQAGAPSFRVANLIRDRKLLELARAEAHRIATGEVEKISKTELSTVMSHLKMHWQRRYGLVEVG
ncbi:MAG TPA: ATP-dependent DNA helicase RecG [Candidatus Sulfotelmatobacter sp.]|nr:ATP-dependent DNA helicase RecG [Terriglobales bacterium]HKT87991.1 ATP-dependent DNA helicase RecG [Candidatus Sulfotelmatobacter sp.]